MRIQSQFKDYYDCMQKFASSDVMPYRRNLLIEEHGSVKYKNIPAYSIQKFAIGFCGTTYYGLKYSYNKHNFQFEENKSFCVYSYEDYNSKLSYPYSKKNSNVIRKFNNYFSIVEDDSFFIEKNTPIFIEFGNKWTCCHTMSKIVRPKLGPNEYPFTLDFVPTLKSFEFDKIFSPELAYMNIESYINGTLAREHKVIPEMENKDKITLHGFDNNSFKN